jgi:hypothetical protein
MLENVQTLISASENVEPEAVLEPQFSSPAATPTPWAEARGRLEKAEVFWLASVRPDGRPHITPLFAVWLDGALYFCTGPGERKAKNLAHNAHCMLMTGCNAIERLDLVVEGQARRVSDEALLRRVEEQYIEKYGWHFVIREGAFYGEGGLAYVYEVAPEQAFGFGKGKSFSQTRWRFEPDGQPPEV